MNDFYYVKKEVKWVNLKNYYGDGFEGNTHWVAVTDITESELRKVCSNIENYEPFVIISFYEWNNICNAFDTLKNNDHREEMRSYRHHIKDTYNDNIGSSNERYISRNNLEEDIYYNDSVCRFLFLAERILSQKQYRRLLLLCKGYSETEIAKLEGVTPSAISQSVALIRKKLIDVRKKVFGY